MKTKIAKQCVESSILNIFFCVLSVVSFLFVLYVLFESNKIITKRAKNHQSNSDPQHHLRTEQLFLISDRFRTLDKQKRFARLVRTIAYRPL